MLTNTSIVLITASVALGALLPLCSPFFRRLRKAKEHSGTEGFKMPDVSIVVSAFDDPKGVLKKLPAYLTQQYSAEYKVVLIVNQDSIKDESYLYQIDQMPNRERLKLTYVPSSSHYMGLRKLAVTLGVKASEYDWILLTDGHTQPTTDRWLAVMARNCAGKDLVIGYTNVKDDPALSLTQRERDFQKYERLLWQLYNLRQAERGVPYSAAGGNLMFKKSMFMSRRGFQSNLKYTFGEYEFLVNDYAEAGNTAVETHPDSWCLKDQNSKYSNDLYHRCFQETRKHLQRKWQHRAIVATDQAVLHLSFPIAFAMMVYAIMQSQWTAAAVAPLALLLGVAAREFLAIKTLKRFSITLKTRPLTLFELAILWTHFIYKVKYQFSDKSEFTSHKH